MLTHSSTDAPVKPRVLIADDSRIVRATLIKHIQGMFDFREALNGEEAWETLLIDPTIRVVITDLAMPKLDGYGLLKKIRGSEIRRIRSLPVVVVSGSDDQAERERAKAAGATDLITKGIGTAQLLTRLDILARLVNTQREFENSLEVLAKNAAANPVIQLLSPDAINAQAEQMLASAIRNQKNFVVLKVLLGLKHVELDAHTGAPPSSVIHAVGQLLQRTIRQADRVAQTGETEFTLVSGNVHVDSVRNFAQRICRAISNANTVKDEHMSFVVSCGIGSLAERGIGGKAQASLESLNSHARQRALLGLSQATTGVVGAEEEQAFARHGRLPAVQEGPEDTEEVDSENTVSAGVLSFYQPREDVSSGSSELATIVQWLKEGQREKVLQHMYKLPQELQSLVELLLQQKNH